METSIRERHCLAKHRAFPGANSDKCPTCRVRLGSNPQRNRADMSAETMDAPQDGSGGCAWDGLVSELETHQSGRLEEQISKMALTLTSTLASTLASTLRNAAIKRRALAELGTCSRDQTLRSKGFRVLMMGNDSWRDPAKDGFGSLLCLVPGLPGTDWAGGQYALVVKYPSDELEPPDCRFTPPLYHQNLFPSGKVCYRILSYHWHPSITLPEILLSIQREFLPNTGNNDPASRQPHHDLRDNPELYRQKIRAQASAHTLERFEALAARVASNAFNRPPAVVADTRYVQYDDDGHRIYAAHKGR